MSSPNTQERVSRPQFMGRYSSACQQGAPLHSPALRVSLVMAISPSSTYHLLLIYKRIYFCGENYSVTHAWLLDGITPACLHAHKFPSKHFEIRLGAGVLRGQEKKKQWLMMDSWDVLSRRGVQLHNWHSAGLILLEHINTSCPASSFAAWGMGLGLWWLEGTTVQGLHSACPSVGWRGCFGKPCPRAGSPALLHMGYMTRNTVCLCGRVTGSRCASFLV